MMHIKEEEALGGYFKTQILFPGWILVCGGNFNAAKRKIERIGQREDPSFFGNIVSCKLGSNSDIELWGISSESFFQNPLRLLILLGSRLIQQALRFMDCGSEISISLRV